MKTINITAKEWFDKVNGNSYFSAQITIDGKETIKLPFQYGYDDQYIHESKRELTNRGLIDCEDRSALWRYCQENNIILTTHKETNCKKSEVKAYGI